MATFGRLALYAAFGASVWAVVTSLIAARNGDLRYAHSGRRGLYAAAGLIGGATVLLVIALVQKDFSLAYVASYTSRSTPRLFSLASLWAGMEGSLLWWTCITAGYAVTAVAFQARRRSSLVPAATAVLGGILGSFLALVAFGANPFELAPFVPRDGAGLNPLLQSPFMWPHPILLYLGLTGFAVPFAFAVAALIQGRLDSSWFSGIRRWTVLSWSFLTLGIILGGMWAYMELGWGGYWAWDPVENASLLPWLTGTAFLHSVLVQERRGMLKIWNVGLVLATYSLAVFGTFLTRSGLLQSVHTFSESPLGKYFLPLLAVLLVGSFALLGWRFNLLRSSRSLEAMLSRETMFLYNNLLFTLMAFTVLWGTLYPVLVEAVTGDRISVGPPFFNSVVAPIGLALVALAGIGPLVTWRRSSFKGLRRQLWMPLSTGAIVIITLGVYGVRSAGTLLAFGISGFTAAATLNEIVAGVRAHRSIEALGWWKAASRMLRRNRRRYGGYVIHLGVVLIAVGIAGGAFKQTWSGELQPGESFPIADYSITYSAARSFMNDEKMVNVAVMEVTKGGERVGTLTPQRNFHHAQSQPQSEIGLRTTLSEDLYLVLTQMDVSKRVTLRAWVTPLVAWIWLGGLVMALGMLVILFERPLNGRPTVARQPIADKVAVEV